MIRGKTVWYLSAVCGLVLILLVFGGKVGAQQEAQVNGISLVTSHDLEFYMNPLLVDFVRPGLTVQLENPTASADGTMSVDVRVTDDRGLPLDRNGIFTPGEVSLRFIVAHLPTEDSTYISYSVRLRTNQETGGSVVQADRDRNGTFEQLADGVYRYTFGTILPAGYPRTETHAIGLYATRDLEEFELGTQISNDVIEFVPDGNAVTVRRDRVSTEACNTCHDPLGHHGGGARREVALCILCHTEQTFDDESGTTVDFKVMIHKIHSGADLPSVAAGTPYLVGGDDFSDVVFPDNIERCVHCHQGASQSTAYLTKPSAAACGSCHDDVDFTTGENHADIAQFNDTQCATCHIPVGDLEFDLSIAGAHTIPADSTQLPGIVFDIVGVESGTAGGQPIVNFNISDKSGNPVDIADMTRLALVMAGPTTDYTDYLDENALGATGSNGSYFYTFETAIDASFTGTMAVGIEGYRNQTLLLNDGSTTTVRDAGLNDVFYFDTGGGTAIPRRQVVALENCNSCHGQLSFHGGNRNNPQQCVLCHNPMNTDAESRGPDDGAAESTHFKTMIHRIHTGENLTENFTILRSRGRTFNFNELRFPGDRRNCVTCHIDGTQQLPLPATALPTLWPRNLINPQQPTAAACLSCHTTRDALIHASLQTSSLGESCAVCHGPNRQFSIDRSHAR